jgi:hypothetical protein
LVCYVVNSWPSGLSQEDNGLTKFSAFQRPVDTIYLMDTEDASWITPITDLLQPNELDDVWLKEHLACLAAGPTRYPWATSGGWRPLGMEAKARTVCLPTVMPRLRIPS